MTWLTVTVQLYVLPDETPTALRDRLQRVIEHSLGRPVACLVAEIEDPRALGPMNPGDYTPV